MSVLGLIPARGGSRGIPRKNIKLLGGKPLIQWTIEAARASGVIDRLVVSTEDAEIADVAEAIGVDEVRYRPDGLARDETPMSAVVWDAIGIYEPDVIVLLQPTSPFREPGWIKETVRWLTNGVASAATSIRIPPRYAPEWAMQLVRESLLPCVERVVGGPRPMRRQDLRATCIPDGSVYAFTSKSFVETGSVLGARPVALIVPETPNLDEPEDWAEAERRVASMLVTA